MNEISLLSGINVLLEGPAGTGKTYSLGTAVEAFPELKFFVLFTENGLETLLGYFTDKGKPIPPNLHWHVVQRTGTSFANLAASAQMINTYAMDALFKLPDPNRSKHNEFEKCLRVLADFEDQRTGEKFGPVDSWGPDRCICMDSLTGLSGFAMNLVVGMKALKDQRDWGVAQDVIEKLLRQLCDGVRAHFILTAHIERETDLVLGGVKIMTSTLGDKLAPKLAPMFSDVILTERTAAKWTWSTANSMADLKTRNLPIKDGITPDFKQLFDKWLSRGGKFVSTFSNKT